MSNHTAPAATTAPVAVSALLPRMVIVAGHGYGEPAGTVERVARFTGSTIIVTLTDGRVLNLRSAAVVDVEADDYETIRDER